MTTTDQAGHPLPYDTYREAIGRETLRFADAVRDADPVGAVPSCPGWTLADLTRHVGALQRWFCVLLSGGCRRFPATGTSSWGFPRTCGPTPTG